MKLLFFALFAALAAGLHAEEALLTATQSTNIETHISSKTAVFQHTERQVIYRGDVVVEDPRVHITCDTLTARLPATGKRVDSIIAESNVVMLVPDKGTTNRATADKAVYTFSINAGVTNEVLELTGSPAIERPDGTLTGTKITWDRLKDTVTADNQHMTFRGTNVPAGLISTNATPEPKATTP